VRNPDARRLDREILALAIPAFATLVAEPLLVLVDTTIVGHLGTSQLAGLTLAANVLGIVIGLSVFLAYGTTATVSRRLGAGDRPGALASGIDGMGLAALMGVGIAAFLILGAPWFLPWYGSSAAATGYGVTYLRIVAFGMPAQLVMLASTGVLRGLQDTRTPLRVVIAANLMNVVLNLWFVFGLGWGIAGAAAGTALSQWAAALTLGGVVLRGARLEGATVGFHPAGVLSAARSGVWLVLRSAALQTAITITTFVAAGMGDVSLAAHQVTTSLWYAMSFAMDAFAIVAQALIGLRLGAGDVAGARAVMRRVVGWGVGFGAVISVLLLAVRPWVGGWFTPDAEVHVALAPALLVLALLVPVGGAAFMMDGVLIGASDMRFLAVASTITVVIYLPFAMGVHSAGLGLAWLWAAYTVWILSRAAILGLRARGVNWARTGA
jgi:putative MATE family efflux protein